MLLPWFLRGLKRAILVKLLLVLILLTGLSGCAYQKKVTLYLIDKQDIFEVKKGTKVGDIVAEKDGFFISGFYLQEVAKARVNQ